MEISGDIIIEDDAEFYCTECGAPLSYYPPYDAKETLCGSCYRESLE